MKLEVGTQLIEKTSERSAYIYNITSENDDIIYHIRYHDNATVTEVYNGIIKNYIVLPSHNYNEDNTEKVQSSKFEKIATEIGQFTDLKNKQYGSSVDATYGMMKVLLERYRHTDGQYLIPEALIEHMLLQVRMMDKINRLFTNPTGKGDSESPYKDLAGYSLIGIDMVENKSTKLANK